MYPDMLLLTPEFSFLPSVFRKPVTAKKSSYTVRVRNPWFALFGLTNHKLHYGNSSIPLRILDLWLINSNYANQRFRTLYTVAHLEKRQVDRMQSSSNATFIERHHFRIVATIDERSATTRRKSRKRKTFLEQKKTSFEHKKKNFAAVILQVWNLWISSEFSARGHEFLGLSECCTKRNLKVGSTFYSFEIKMRKLDAEG